MNCPHLHPLESRLHLAASAVLSGGTLFVRGHDNLANTIRITRAVEPELISVLIQGRSASGRVQQSTNTFFAVEDIDLIRVIGGARNDNIQVGLGFPLDIDTYVDARGGNDLVNTSYGDDTLVGGTGNDRLNASSGNDVLRGDSGLDTLWGSSGSDILTGGVDRDVLFGGDGNDRLTGGVGRDFLYGEFGADRFTDLERIDGSDFSSSLDIDDRNRANNSFDDNFFVVSFGSGGFGSGGLRLGWFFTF